MADTTTPPVTTAVNTGAANPVIQLEQDLAVEVTDAIDAIKAYRTGGYAALTAKAPALVPHIEALVADVKTAMPTVKAGYKTTEFWLTAVAGAAVVLVPTITGHPLPIDTTVVVGALTAVYTLIRGSVKNAPTVG